MKKLLFVGGAVAIVVSYALLFLLGPAAVDAWVAEDWIAESVGALSLLATSIFFLLLLVNGRRERLFGKFKQLTLAGLVILFFFGAGEEVSWGQRYFGLATPAELESRNVQGEMNVHNLENFSGWLEADRLFQVFWLVLAVVVPVAAALSERARVTLDRFIPVLPLWVAVYLVFNQLVAMFANLVNEANPSWYEGRYYEYAGGRFELTEAVVAVILALGAYALYRRTRTSGVGVPAGAVYAQSRPEAGRSA